MRLPLAGLLALALAVPVPARGAPLAGRWAMEASPDDVLELRADGTGSMAGDPIRWSAQGDRLVFLEGGGQEQFQYRLEGDRLVLVSNGIPLAFRRVGAAKPGRTAATAPEPTAPARTAERGASAVDAAEERARAAEARAAAAEARAQAAEARAAAAAARTQGAAPAEAPARARPASGADAQLVQLLVSSAWCSFHYSGSGGYDHSSTSRVALRPDGTGSITTGGESHSVGYAGTYTGASQGGGALRWKVQNARLLIDQGAGFQDVNLVVNRNSNGYPILVADGVEYMTCR